MKRVLKVIKYLTYLFKYYICAENATIGGEECNIWENLLSLSEWARAPIAGHAVVAGWAAGGQPYEDRTIATKIVFY